MNKSHTDAAREGGAGNHSASISASSSASISASVGDIARDSLNVFGVLDAQQTERLNTSQRSFINDLQIPARLGHLGMCNIASDRMR